MKEETSVQPERKYCTALSVPRLSNLIVGHYPLANTRSKQSSTSITLYHYSGLARLVSHAPVRNPLLVLLQTD